MGSRKGPQAVRPPFRVRRCHLGRRALPRGDDPLPRTRPRGEGRPAGLEVTARGGVQGFVYTHTGQGAPFVRVEILDRNELREFRFVASYPGGKGDFQRVDFDALHPASAMRDLDLPGFLAELDKVPCCAADPRGRPEADPLDIVR
ncbi:MAG: LssY C-terminus [Anaeromyxobacteraceae bacterium]|nr:LssY C-terminus [Anaeromyxobacteraceae bacterium]